MNILHICADPKPTEESATKQLAVAFFTKIAQLSPDTNITNVDLYENPPPYLSYQAIRGFWYPVFIEGHQPTELESKEGAYAIEQGKLFNESDVVVLTVPMWNYSAPGILKSWMDQVLSPSVTYNLDKTGARPLHRVKRLVLLASSGDTFKEEDPRDSLSPLIRDAFQAVGIYELSIAWADGQYEFIYSDSEQRKAMAVEAADELAEEIAEELGSAVS